MFNGGLICHECVLVGIQRGVYNIRCLSERKRRIYMTSPILSRFNSVQHLQISAILRVHLLDVRCRKRVSNLFTSHRNERERKDPEGRAPGFGGHCLARCLISRTETLCASRRRCRQHVCRSGRCDVSLLRRRGRLSVGVNGSISSEPIDNAQRNNNTFMNIHEHS